MKALKRLGRFFVGQPRFVMSMKFEESQFLDIYVDSNWAGCSKTRRSTSGGCAMVGGHMIKSWSSTQTTLALNSGEAEHYALIKGVGIGMGLQELLRDLGEEKIVRVHTDSSAAEGICKMIGLGTQRHLAVGTLWVQQKLRQNKFLLYKIKGDNNPADLFTKHLAQDKMQKCLKFLGGEFCSGRPSVAPERKQHERIIGEDLDWEGLEEARHEICDKEGEQTLQEELQAYEWQGSMDDEEEQEEQRQDADRVTTRDRISHFDMDAGRITVRDRISHFDMR